MSPQIVVLISGKRKSGKDFVANSIVARMEGKCDILRTALPIKQHWAKQFNLDIDKLCDTSEYKEIYRKEMVTWGEQQRQLDPGVFCRIAVRAVENNNKSVWLVADTRRKSDIVWFTSKYGEKVKTVRISAPVDVRVQRGFKFTPGIDDSGTECELDDYEDWTMVIDNSGQSDVNAQLDKLESMCRTAVNAKQRS